MSLQCLLNDSQTSLVPSLNSLTVVRALEYFAEFTFEPRGGIQVECCRDHHQVCLVVRMLRNCRVSTISVILGLADICGAAQKIRGTLNPQTEASKDPMYSVIQIFFLPLILCGKHEITWRSQGRFTDALCTSCQISVVEVCHNRCCLPRPTHDCHHCQIPSGSHPKN